MLDDFYNRKMQLAQVMSQRSPVFKQPVGLQNQAMMNEQALQQVNQANQQAALSDPGDSKQKLAQALAGKGLTPAQDWFGVAANALEGYNLGTAQAEAKKEAEAKKKYEADARQRLAKAITEGNFEQVAQYNPELAAKFIANSEDSKFRNKELEANLAYKRQIIDLEKQKLSKEKEAQKGFQGTGMDAQIYNILLYGDPASPEYALAYSQAMQPKIVTIPDPNDPSRLIQAAIEPKLPSAIRKPLSGQTTAQPAAPQAADAMQMPAAAPQAAPPQTNDGFTVTPIGGTSRSKDLSKDERDAATFADRMKDAELTFAKSETPSTIERGVSNLPIVGNFLASPNTQSFQQAERNFVNATLRRESGATISPSEFSNARQQYVPQPGDSLEVLQQKQKNRQTVMQGLRNASGQSKILTYNPATGKLE